ncbi:MAG: hypothetical protein FJ086_13530, partial [Deltaproteobacteria bacterium]|nr:hypothetical protein [Deltaproteobacteria bacterium]
RRSARQALSWLLPDPQACVAAFQVDEPHVPWNGPYLRQRAACYERASAPGAARAREELQSFLAAEAAPLFPGQAVAPAARPEDPERAEGP